MNKVVFSIFLLVCIVLLIPAFIGASPWSENPVRPEKDPRLEKAVRFFEEAKYDKALPLLKELEIDYTLSIGDRQEALHLLGSIYIVMRDKAKARQCIEKWMLTEPPLVKADPDRDFPEFVHLYYDIRREYNVKRYCPASFAADDPCQFGVVTRNPGIKTVAIIDFDNNAIDDRERLAPLGAGLADLFIRSLEGQIELEIVEREHLQWLLREIGLNNTGLIDAERAVQLGRILGAHSVLVGDYLYLNNTLTLGVRLIEVESSRILLTATEEGKLKHFLDIVQQLSDEFIETIDVKLDRRRPSYDQIQFDAFLQFAEGLEKFDQGEYSDALELFSGAVELDPYYVAAQQRSLLIQRLLENE